mmetsp:Transcript_129831/g.327722  ORF Transcript_129831/g.327722 Transcript_129831/m.327722 type:complete len:241 (+) Transcript_129831:132-854(+)
MVKRTASACLGLMRSRCSAGAAVRIHRTRRCLAIASLAGCSPGAAFTQSSCGPPSCHSRRYPLRPMASLCPKASACWSSPSLPAKASPSGWASWPSSPAGTASAWPARDGASGARRKGCSETSTGACTAWKLSPAAPSVRRQLRRSGTSTAMLESLPKRHSSMMTTVPTYKISISSACATQVRSGMWTPPPTRWKLRPSCERSWRNTGQCCSSGCPWGASEPCLTHISLTLSRSSGLRQT